MYAKCLNESIWIDRNPLTHVKVLNKLIYGMYKCKDADYNAFKVEKYKLSAL